MADCKSTYSVVNDLWSAYRDYAKAALGIAVSALATPAAGVAAVTAANKVEDVMSKAKSFWNDNVGKDSWARIGPRPLELNTTHRGNVVGPTERTFISEVPCHSDRIRIQLWESGGRSQTDVTVCLLDGAGNHSEVVRVTLNETEAEKDQEHQVVDKTFSGALGKYVVCIINAKAVFGSFRYALQQSNA